MPRLCSSICHPHHSDTGGGPTDIPAWRNTVGAQGVNTGGGPTDAAFYSPTGFFFPTGSFPGVGSFGAGGGGDGGGGGGGGGGEGGGAFYRSRGPQQASGASGLLSEWGGSLLESLVSGSSDGSLGDLGIPELGSSPSAGLNCSSLCSSVASLLSHSVLSKAELPQSDLSVSLRLRGLTCMYAFCIAVVLSLSISVLVDNLDDHHRERANAGTLMISLGEDDLARGDLLRFVVNSATFCG